MVEDIQTCDTPLNFISPSIPAKDCLLTERHVPHRRYQKPLWDVSTEARVLHSFPLISVKIRSCENTAPFVTKVLLQCVYLRV